MLRIDETSQERLRVRYRPSYLWPAGLTLIALALGWLVATSIEVECIRSPEGQVDLTLRDYRAGCGTRTRKVIDVQHARVDVNRDRLRHRLRDRRRNPSPTYRVMLVSGDRSEHPVTTYWTGDEQGHRQMADEIEAFLRDPKARRATIRDEPSAGWWLLALLPVFGAAIVFAGSGECIVDRARGLVTVARWGLFSRQRIDVPLDEVDEFRVLDKPGSRQQVYAAGLVRRGVPLALTHAWSSSSNFASRLTSVLERYRAASRSSPSSAADELRGGGSRERPKICARCGRDCSGDSRVQDPAGNYYHLICYESARS